MNKFTTLATGITLAVASIGAFAQAAAPVTPRVDRAKRTSRRASRPASPAASSAPTRRSRLEREQAQIRAAECQAKSDGIVTPRERRHLGAGAGTGPSANIHAAKHDARSRTADDGER